MTVISTVYRTTCIWRNFAIISSPSCCVLRIACFTIANFFSGSICYAMSSSGERAPFLVALIFPCSEICIGTWRRLANNIVSVVVFHHCSIDVVANSIFAALGARLSFAIFSRPTFIALAYTSTIHISLYSVAIAIRSIRSSARGNRNIASIAFVSVIAHTLAHARARVQSLRSIFTIQMIAYILARCAAVISRTMTHASFSNPILILIPSSWRPCSSSSSTGRSSRLLRVRGTACSASFRIFTYISSCTTTIGTGACWQIIGLASIFANDIGGTRSPVWFSCRSGWRDPTFSTFTL